jgi:hypothetical protein
MLKTIYNDAKVTLQVLKAAADNETLTGTGVDMKGYDVVEFIFGILEGDVANHSIKAAQDSDSAFGTAADLLGTAKTVAATATVPGLAVLTIVKPEERYVRPVLTIANITAVPAFCIAVQHTARTSPGASNTGELHVSPIEGTA